MRVAAVYDIHGNLPALEAVLQEIRHTGVDQIVVGGDVMPGPMPREALACLLNLDIPVRFIHGNGESAVLAHLAGKDIGSVPQPFREIIYWTAQQLPPEYARTLTGWPMTLHIEIAGLGDALFCHATPSSDTEIFTRMTPAENLLPVFAGLNVPVVICGHTHMQFDRMIGKIRVVNAGSVGMPFGEPGAYWLLLGPEVQFRRTRYDLAQAAERIRSSNYPQAQEFVAQNLLQPRSEEDALRMFSNA